MPMLSKAATSFRPFLRLQSHQPDLFTSNPSLLHHFQQHGLVAQGAAQTATGNGGAAGGAGRAYSGASSGGYTGHARAFLSLPGSGADISGVNTSTEDREKSKARQRAGLALKQRSANAAAAESTLPRTVMMKDRMSQRVGSRPVAMVEMREEAEVAELEGPQSRGSIAYPSWSALPSDAAAGGALWIPGAAPRQLGGARAFSTSSVRHTEDDEIPVPLVSATPAPGSHRIDQPNRVLQDLAGLDLFRPGRVGQKRRNSTASVLRPDIDSPMEAGEKSQDLQIYQAINKARKTDPKLARAMVEHYRTPRSASHPAEGHPQLAAQLPLENGYTTATYNICLEVVLEQRQRGESIAPILDMYNEMLVRDVVPNMRTTALVIHALCLREEDVSAASRRWAGEQMRDQFNLEKLGIPPRQESKASSPEHVIQAYQSEDNLASAINLFSIASSFYTGKGHSQRAVLADLLNAAASSIGLAHTPSRETIQPLIDEYIRTLTPVDAVYGGVAATFDLLTSYGDHEAAVALWKSLMTDKDHAAVLEDVKRPGISDIRAAAVRSLVAAGDIQTAEQIAATQGLVQQAFISSLAKAGKIDEAIAQLATATKKSLNSPVWVPTYDIAEALLAAGRLQESVSTMTELRKHVFTSSRRMDYTRVGAMYAHVLAEAFKNPELLDLALEASVNVSPAWEPALRAKHIELLVQNGRYDDINAVLLSSEPRGSIDSHPDFVHSTGDHLLREAFASVVTSDAPISVVLEAVRSFARIGHPVTHALDSVPIPTIIVDKYVASRARVQEVGELGIHLDGWFRLLEVFDKVPTAHIDAGAIDAALETFMTDLGDAQKSAGLKLPNTIFRSSSVSDLVQILGARFGNERANELVTSAFGSHAAANLLLPTLEQSNASTSEAEFSMPPTPESAEYQPPAHALQITNKLAQLINKATDYQQPSPAQMPTAQEVFDKISETVTQERAVPPPGELARLIAPLGRAGDAQKVNELYQIAQVALQSLSEDPHAQAQQWRAVEDAMIAACCFLGELEQAGLHRARIIEAGMAPSADAYATMIASSRDSTDDALVARELFDESQSLGVVPHLYLFNTIIAKLSRARKAEMALDLFQHMKAAGIRPSSVTYGAVINACCRVGDAESAKTLFEEMASQRNFKAKVPPFNTMMQFHLQTRPSRESVLHYYDAMRAARVSPSAHTYKLLLDAYGTLPPTDLKAMSRVFNELVKDRRVPVQGTHWASLITAYGLHADQVKKAIEVFDGIPSHPSTTSAIPEPVVWEAILNVLGQKGTFEQFDAMRRRLDQSGCRPTAYVYNVLIAGYAAHGKIDEARAVFESMADSVVGVAAPNNHPALLTSSGHVKPSSTTASTNRVYREPSTYEVMVRAELKAGDRPRAEAVLARMEERRYPVAVWMKARAILDEQI